jgi:hypothetical protein
MLTFFLEVLTMYRIWLVNFEYYLQDTYHSWTEALEKAKKVGFQVRIDCGNNMVASVCPLQGTNIYYPELAA